MCEIYNMYENTHFKENSDTFQKANPARLWMRLDNLLGLMNEFTGKDHLLCMLPAVISKPLLRISDEKGSH